MEKSDRPEKFMHQARLARERAAAAADADFRGQWLRVAEMWEMLAKEYARLSNVLPEQRR